MNTEEKDVVETQITLVTPGTLAARDDQRGRRRYETPRVVEYGDVRTLTRGNGGSKADFNGHPQATH